MTIERGAALWIEQRADYSVEEVADLSGLPPHVLDDLVACGALPVSAAGARTSARFAAEGVVLARAAAGLRWHFELDDSGLAVALSLLRRVRALEARLARMRALAPEADEES